MSTGWFPWQRNQRERRPAAAAVPTASTYRCTATGYGGAASDKTIGCQGKEADASPRCGVDGVGDCWGDSDDRGLASSRGGDVGAVEHSDVDWRHVSEPRHPVGGQGRVQDLSVLEVDGLEQGATKSRSEERRVGEECRSRCSP